MKRLLRWLICLALSVSLVSPGSFVHAASKGEQVVALAITHIGQRYVYGAAGPDTFDCSGFTMYIYKQVGVSIPHATSLFNNGGYTKYGGRRVELNSLQPGDLVFFGYNDNNITHVAIYVGNGKVINALNETYGVRYTYLTQALCRQYGGDIYWNTANGTYPLFGARFFEDMNYQDYNGQVESSSNTGSNNVSVAANNINKIQNNWIDTDSDNTSGDVYMPDINENPIGDINNVTVVGKWITVTGWTLDLDHTSDRLNLKVYLNDELLGVSSTTSEDSWVNGYYNVSGSHGYNVSLLASSLGKYTLSVYATDPDTEEDILIGSKQIIIDNSDYEEQSKTVGDSISLLPFADVSSDKWYYPVIQEIYNLKWMTGISSIAFEPSKSMTRAMAVTVLYRMAGSPYVEYSDYFSDVEDGKYYSDAVTWGKETGVVVGYQDGTFNPSANITRQEMVVLLFKFAKYNKVDVECPTYDTDLDAFDDSSEVSSWARYAMCWAVENGLISGDQGSLNPKDEATRAQCAKMLLAMYRLL